MADNVELEKCDTPGCRAMIMRFNGTKYQRKIVNGETIFAPHKCKLVPPAVAPTKLFYVEWINRETKRHRYSRIDKVVSRGLLRPPDLSQSQQDYKVKSGFDFVGIFRCIPKWEKLSEEETRAYFKEVGLEFE